MNNELEELLDYISDRIIGKEKWNKVRDYITNLQKENNNLKTSLDESQEVVIDLQQRIEKAIEYIRTNEGFSQISYMWEFYGDTDELVKILRGDENDN